MGFTAGVLVMIIACLMRVFDLTMAYVAIIQAHSIIEVGAFFVAFSVLLLVIGFMLNGKSFEGYGIFKKDSGRLISDFVTDYGVGLTFINMGVLGLASLAYVWVVGGALEG